MKKLFFLGPVGSFSYDIAERVFPGNDRIACDTFTDIVKNILRKKNSIGILPIENSITSDIHENMDFLFNYNLKIIAEGFLSIKLNLIGLKNAKLSDIKTVYSHYKALEQCKIFIGNHMLSSVASKSTASAVADIVALNKIQNAAITGKTLAGNKRLIVLKEDIGDVKFNMSRFVFVTKDKSELDATIKNKISFICIIAHRPGTLARFLNVLAKLGVNLTKIESRPIPNTDWEYHFWLDVELDTTVLPLSTILAAIKSETLEYRTVGIYEIGKKYE